MSIINSNINNVPIDECFVWVGILNSLVIYSTARDDTGSYQYWRDNLYAVSGTYLIMASVMASNIADCFID